MTPGTTGFSRAGGYTESPANPGLDQQLLTATAGDQFTMIDWRRVAGSWCTDPVSSLPRLPVVVLGVSGKTVILADARLPGVADYTSSAGQAYWKSVADSTEASYLPAVRSVLSASYTPLQSANGRTFTLITDLSVGGGSRGEAGTIAPAAFAPRACARTHQKSSSHFWPQQVLLLGLTAQDHRLPLSCTNRRTSRTRCLGIQPQMAGRTGG